MGLGCRAAGEWLRTGKYRVEPDLYRETRSPVDRIIQKALEAGACEVVIDPTEAKVLKPGPACPAFRPKLILPDGQQKEYDMLLLARQMAGIEQDLKRHTLLDAEQAGDELTGALEMPSPSGTTCQRCRVAFRPTHQGTVIRLTTAVVTGN